MERILIKNDNYVVCEFLYLIEELWIVDGFLGGGQFFLGVEFFYFWQIKYNIEDCLFQKYMDVKIVVDGLVII